MSSDWWGDGDRSNTVSYIYLHSLSKQGLSNVLRDSAFRIDPLPALFGSALLTRSLAASPFPRHPLSAPTLWRRCLNLEFVLRVVMEVCIRSKGAPSASGLLVKDRTEPNSAESSFES